MSPKLENILTSEYQVSTTNLVVLGALNSFTTGGLEKFPASLGNGDEMKFPDSLENFAWGELEWAVYTRFG